MHLMVTQMTQSFADCWITGTSPGPHQRSREHHETMMTLGGRLITSVTAGHRHEAQGRELRVTGGASLKDTLTPVG